MGVSGGMEVQVEIILGVFDVLIGFFVGVITVTKIFSLKGLTRRNPPVRFVLVSHGWYVGRTRSSPPVRSHLSKYEPFVIFGKPERRRAHLESSRP